MVDPSAVVYASDRYTTHDHRFLASAVASGNRRVWFVRFGATGHYLERRSLPSGVELIEIDDAPSDKDLRTLLTDLLLDPGSGEPVGVIHAGPIPTVGRRCVASSPVPVIVMSWGSDLLVDANVDQAIAAGATAALVGAAHVLVDNAAVGRAAITLGASPDRLSVVPWGVDLATFRFVPTRPTPGPLRLLSLRSFEPVYDMATVIAGVALAVEADDAPPITLSIAGSGSLESDLREQAAVAGIDHVITWLGRVSEPDVANLLADHDVHLSAALSDGSSISLLQAMASGRPSIVTAIESNLEWVTPGVNGWTFAPGNPVDLSRCILSAALTGPLDELGRAARTVAEDSADWERNREHVLNLYDEIANTPRT